MGPVQLIALGFQHPDFRGEIIAEMERLGELETVRVLDALAVYKDVAGDIEIGHLFDLNSEVVPESGSILGELLGLEIEGETRDGDGAAPNAGQAGADQAGAAQPVGSEAEEWDVLEEIPNDSAVALILLEHTWAAPLRDAVLRAGGFPISDGFISPFDLAAIGLMPAERAQELLAMESVRIARR
jgi:hypothetical protein